jgi:hypothetical protein
MVDIRLVEYIQNSLLRNIPLEQIKNILYSKGWKELDINEAINLVNKKIHPQPVQQPRQQIPRQNIQRPRPIQNISPRRPISEESKKVKPKINLIFLFAGIFGLLLIFLIVFLIVRNTSIISDEKLSQGISLNLKEDKEIKFKISEEEHSLKIDSISEDSIRMVVQSDPVIVILNVGENKKIDFEKDGIYDFYIRLNNIFEGEADILFKKISEECIEDWDCEDWGECEEGSQSRICEDLNDCNTEKDKPEEIQDCEIILTCSEQEGVLCLETEICNGTITNSSNGDCCLGECEEIELETIDCETDIDCLINASKKCHPANLTYNFTIDMSILGWIQSHSFYYKIRGIEKEKCEFYQELLFVNGSYTESARQSFKEDGKTDEEIDVLEQEQNNALEITIGDTGLCKYPISSYGLQEYLANLKEGTFSSFSDEELEEYQCAGDIYNA